MLAAMDEAWEEIRLNEQEFIDGGDRIVVISRMIGKGRGSGVEVERPVNGQVWTIRKGRVTRLELGFTDRDDALTAAGPLVRFAAQPAQVGNGWATHHPRPAASSGAGS